ncbi:ISXo2 transposase [Neisseria macacae ATCC 33926]|uniref:ISXo2 transposase n=1 Tax=Neisseria macacae ATCC 33926 TaxID=997348 RepID=A0AA36XJN4_9NEIS|nr:ISXo2 transposase [Neisseria macacae ATCC 33926]
MGTRSSENGGEGYAAAEVQAAGISDLRYTFPRLCTLLMRKAAKL